MTNPESHIKMLQRFWNFWANVSSIKVASTVSDDTQRAIVRGTEKAYGDEDSHGRESE